MKSIIVIFIVGVISIASVDISQVYAQSGSRGGGGGGISGGGGLSGGSFYRRHRLSPFERQQLAQQQLELQQKQVQQQAQQQAVLAKQQFKQNLISLGLKKNRSSNSRQYKLAFAEAENDYANLRVSSVEPIQVGPLQQPFRLTNKDIDRVERTANWPRALRSEKFSAMVKILDSAIMEGSVTDSESANEFLNDLEMLNAVLNTAAIRGEVSAKDYARAKRFVTGLANEVRATNLVM